MLPYRAGQDLLLEVQVYSSNTLSVGLNRHKLYPFASDMCAPDVGTGLFQYFIKLVPTIHTIAPDSSEEQSEQRSETRRDATVTTSQFAYTFKFRSLKGFTEYHRGTDADDPEHHAAHGEERGEEETPPTQVLPGVVCGAVKFSSSFHVFVCYPLPSAANHLGIVLLQKPLVSWSKNQVTMRGSRGLILGQWIRTV